MTYFGLPPFYPPGWFWIGGRLAALTGTPAWEMFKPWAIISITVGDRCGIRVVGEHDSLRVRVDRVDGHRRGDTGVFAGRALCRDHHRAAAAGLRAGLVRVARWHARRRLGRGDRRRHLPRFRRAVLHAAAGLQRVHADDHGGGCCAVTPQASGSAAAACGHRGDRRSDRADRLAAVPVGRNRRIAGRYRHRPALPAVRRRAAVLPDASVHAARRAVHARHAVAGGPRPHLDPCRCAGHRRARRLRLVAAVDADHAGGHHAAVVPAAADADRAADRRRCVRVHRGHAGDRPPLPARKRGVASSPRPGRSARSAR